MSRRATKRATKTSSKRALVHGYRSGLEELNASVLKGQAASYEEYRLEYIQPEKLRKYTPDFVLNNGIVIETKGRFLTADRQKHLMIKECHPDLDIRFVFSNPHQTISKQSKTTYAMWCDHKGFKWAARVVPEKWMKEPARQRAVAAAEKAFDWKGKRK